MKLGRNYLGLSPGKYVRGRKRSFRDTMKKYKRKFRKWFNGKSNKRPRKGIYID